MTQHDAWIEAIVLFQTIREGNQPAAKRLLDSSSSRDEVVERLLSMLGVFLRSQKPTELDHFITTAHRAGPPPKFGARPYLPPLP